MDASLFKNGEISNCINGDYKQCEAIHRLVVALKYYSNLNVENEEKDRETFRSFMDLYHQIVDDNNHFMAMHSDQLNEICAILMDGKSMCTMNGCTASQRHFDESKNNVQNDSNLNFYVNLFDSMHFMICHCYDGGFRVKQSEANDEDIDDKTLFDAEFARIQTTVRKSDFETAPFERISPQNNAKFVLSKAEKGDTTFLDELYKHLNSEMIHIQKLRETVKREDYETESIKMDVLNYANIKIGKQAILRFITAINVQSNTFSVGMRFYYWTYYQNREKLPARQQRIGWNNIDNKHDHGGYTVSELCIKQKYGSLKEECANYKNLDIDGYNAAYAKARAFMKSAQIKAMSAKYTYHNYGNGSMFLHYGISFGALVCFHHILSLIFYTDFSKLCTAFSATFRRINPFETLKSIKQRNALYFWMSKYLRELVELFGQCSYGDTKVDRKYIDQLKGPFYCGMNFELNVGSFAMRLNSPSSTSNQLAVAIKFSGPTGVAFTFNNPRSIQYSYLRAFACSHISRFKEEDECLFFGGFYRIKVVNVHIMKNNKNMKIFVLAIFEFDKALNGHNFCYFDKETKNSYFIIDTLIKIRLKKQTKNVVLPQYILNCFQSFCVNKKQISLDLDQLNDRGDQCINKLLFYSWEERDCTKEFTPNDDDFSNVVHSDLFVLFPNVTSLTIETDTGFSFCFSLLALLDVISETNLNEIIIKSKEESGHCWIKSIWNSAMEKLRKKYAAKGFKITMYKKRKKYNLKITSL